MSNGCKARYHGASRWYIENDEGTGHSQSGHFWYDLASTETRRGWLAPERVFEWHLVKIH
jgi:hypothetical protein